MSRLGQRLPLRSAWYGLVLMASLLPALTLVPWLGDQAEELLFDRAMLREEMHHQQIETRLYLETERLVSVLQNKANTVAYFLAQGDGRPMIRSLIERIVARGAMVNTATVYDAQARVIARVARGEHTEAVIDSEARSFVIPMMGRNFLGAPVRLQDGHVEFLISVPLQTGNDVIGVLAGTINVDDFWQKIRSDMPPHQSSVYLIDGRGRLLTRLSDGRYRQGDLLTSQPIVRSLLAGQGWHERGSYRGFEGDEVFGVATLIRGLKWGIVSEIPARAIVDPVESSLMTLAAIVIVWHLLFGLLALLLSRRMLGPITAVAFAVRQAALGDYSRRLPASRFREINELMIAFNLMVREIEKREKSLGKLSQAVEYAAEAVLITDRHGVIEYVNPAFSHISGYAREEAIGKTPAILKSGMQDVSFYADMWKAINQGENWEGELINRRKDGSHYPVLMSIAPILNEGGITHYVAIQQDISERSQLEEQLRHAQKMEALGTLVGGIAHDFNNILAGITGNLYLIQRLAEGQPDMLGRLERVNGLIESAARMISQLLSFARKDAVQMRGIDLAALIRNAMDMVAASIPASIALYVDAGEAPMLVRGDETQLQQMLMNLLANARDALDGRDQPVIEVSLTVCSPDKDFLDRHPAARRREYAMLSIRDNGHGIAPEDIRNIFEPFFTTKKVGEGSGLGLAMVFGAMQTHDGVIEVDSEPGSGTCFRLYFPLVEQGEGCAQSGPGEVLDGRGETILIVDDNVALLEMMREVFGELGYRVLTAANGERGLALYREHRGKVDLVLSDVVMPETGGVQMVEQIRREEPDMPVVFVTGYDWQELLPGYDESNTVIAGKPMQIDQLSHQVRRLLDARLNSGPQA